MLTYADVCGQESILSLSSELAAAGKHMQYARM
jgi:hypothetical protein